MRGALIALPLLAWALPAAAQPAGELPLPPDDEFDAATDAPPATPDVVAPEVAAPEPAAPAVTPAPEVAPEADAPESPAPAATAPESAPAPAATAPHAATPVATAHAREQLAVHHTLATERPGLPRFGTMADVGMPDGATVSIVYRPFRMLRAHAGISHNFISLGQRVGVTFAPLDTWVRPTLSVEYGRYAEGNANPLARMVSGDQTFSSSTLDRVGYRYANARLGLELGRKWFTFYVHAGASYVNGTVHNLSAAMMSESSGTTSVTFSNDPTVRMWTVSARLGFVVYLAK